MGPATALCSVPGQAPHDFGDVAMTPDTLVGHLSQRIHAESFTSAPRRPATHVGRVALPVAWTCRHRWRSTRGRARRRAPPAAGARGQPSRHEHDPDVRYARVRGPVGEFSGPGPGACRHGRTFALGSCIGPLSQAHVVLPPPGQIPLCAGSKRVAREARALGIGVVSFEIRDGIQFDVCQSVVRSLIEAWMSGGCIAWVCMATPCSSWSLARQGPEASPWGPLHSAAFVMGLPSLSVADQAKVKIGNRLS